MSGQNHKRRLNIHSETLADTQCTKVTHMGKFLFFTLNDQFDISMKAAHMKALVWILEALSTERFLSFEAPKLTEVINNIYA